MEQTWRNLSDAIADHATRQPGAHALIEGGLTLSYAHLADLIGRASVVVHDWGVEPRDVVALAMPGGIDHLILTFALLRVGAIPLDVSPGFLDQAAAWLTSALNIRHACVPKGTNGPEALTVHAIAPDWRASLQRKAGDRRVARDADEPHFLTLVARRGRQHAIAVTHRQWLARMESVRRLIPALADPGTRLLLPGSVGDFALLFACGHLCGGGTVVLTDPALPAAEMPALIESHPGAACVMPPPLCRILLSAASGPSVASGDAMLFPGLRALLVRATGLYPVEKVAASRRLSPNVCFFHGDAASGLVAVLGPADLPARADTIGRPDPLLSVVLSDAGGVPVEAGALGYVRLRGPGVAAPPLGAARTNAMFRDGWYDPDEVGTLAPDGFLTLRGRGFHLVASRGRLVFLPDIERVLRRHEAVAEAVALVVRVEPSDTRIMAFVVLGSKVAPDMLARHCRDALPADQLPDEVRFVRALPRRNGQIDGQRLLAELDGPPSGQGGRQAGAE